MVDQGTQVLGREDRRNDSEDRAGRCRAGGQGTSWMPGRGLLESSRLERREGFQYAVHVLPISGTCPGHILVPRLTGSHREDPSGLCRWD